MSAGPFDHFTEHRSVACRRCIDHAIGGALVRIDGPAETPRGSNGDPVGCCAVEAPRYAFTYRLERDAEGRICE